MEEPLLVRTPCQMWQDYLFLTKEMVRFLEEEEFDLFNELLNQRETLQKQLETVKEQGFHHSPEGKQVLIELRQLNKQMVFKLRYLLNRAEKHRKIGNAYEGIFSSFASNKLDWKS